MLVTKFCRMLFGVSIAALGIHHFIQDYFILQKPGPDSWIDTSFLFVGFLYKIGLITLSLAIVFHYKPRPSSILLGGLILIWAMFRHMPLVILNFTDPAELNFMGMAMAIAGGAFIVADSFQNNVLLQQNASVLFGVCRLHSFGKFFFGLPMLVFGIQHLLYAEFISTIIPDWIPGNVFWAYATGFALICAGISIILAVKTKSSVLWLGIMIMLWMLILHLPAVIMNPKAEYEWTSLFQSLAIGVSAFILYANLSRKSFAAGQSTKHKNLEPNRARAQNKKHLYPRKPQLKSHDA